MQAILIEFIGSLVFFYVVITTKNALFIGLTLALCIYLGGKISGGNFNPAITLMLVVANKQQMSTLLPYVLAQVAGALAAIELYKRVKI